MSGVEHFSGYEVVQAAMEVEKNGHRFYAGMAGRAHDPALKELFSWLAQDEVEHLRRLGQLEATFSAGAYSEAADEFLPYLRQFRDSEIFPSAERLEKVLQEANADLRVLELAIEAEEKFSAYFHLAATHARIEDGREAFTWLAGEEKRHAELLRQRRSKLSGS